MCEHLEAITDGVEMPNGMPYNRLLINIPPGTMKSFCVSVFWPAWEWGPCELTHLRYVCASHSLESVGVRDSMRMRRLISSDWYQARWPHVTLTKDQNQKTKFENTSTGFRQAISAGGITGVRGDRVICDDPHSVEGANSDQQRNSTNLWFQEAVPLRLNNPDSSAIVVVMQRLHEEDVSGIILDKQLGYDHLMLPMEYDPARAAPTMIGFSDPRTEPGELLFPARFSREIVDRDKKVLGSFASAGQFQQEPAPRGGGIIKREWWQPWDAKAFPAMDYIIASLDTAYTQDSENDPSALTIWGVFTGASAREITAWASSRGKRHDQDEAGARFDEAAAVKWASAAALSGGDLPRVMLMHAWAERLDIHNLVEKTAATCKQYKVDKLLIENKAAGHSVAQEIRRLFGHEKWMVQLLDPKRQDKLSRLYSVQHLFAEGMIFAPDRAWAEMVIQQTSVFPKGKHDDLVDTASQALRYLRDIGLLTRAPEWTADIQDSMRQSGKPLAPIYPG
jgi:predicted phage terminase large subunit-like protein